MGLLGNIFNTTTHISLAVVGTSSSGKSYLISDMIAAFSNMGMLRYELKGYRDFGHYERDVTTDDKHNPRPKTDPYACRSENHYGAEFDYNGKHFQLDFLNIPGEIFHSDELNRFFQIRKLLVEKCKNRFMLTTWTDGFNDEIYVEPVGVSPDAAKAIEDAKQTGYIQATAKERQLAYLTWEQIYAVINPHGRNLQMTGKPKMVSGKYLLEHIREFNTDSVIRSIAEVVATLGIGMDAYDFMAMSISFYFFNYCYNATDMVICDKMILPSEDTIIGVAEINPFIPLVQQLKQFFTMKGANHPRTYMAFRGVDFLFKSKEKNWRRILGLDAISGLTDMQRRNAIYAICSLLIHNYRFPGASTRCTTEDFNDYIGMNVPNWGNGSKNILDFLSEILLDTDPSDGHIMTGGTLRSHFNMQLGMQLQQLMNMSYKVPCVIGPGQLLSNMMRHVYYTATPISDDFFVFENDSESNNQCFIYPTIQGSARYFHNYGSHLCFGTYQLCLDLLRQNNILANVEGGSLYPNLTEH